MAKKVATLLEPGETIQINHAIREVRKLADKVTVVLENGTMIDISKTQEIEVTANAPTANAPTSPVAPGVQSPTPGAV